MKQREIFPLVLFSLIITAFPHPVISLPNPGKPGAYFWGDANGNGIIDANDITVIQTAFAGGAYTIQDVIPDSGYTQELTGNGLWADAGDITQVMNYFQGDFSTKPGQPDVVVLEGATHITLMEGESVEISAYALDNEADSDGKTDKRAGWGIVFRVDPAGMCTDVYIQGRDVLPQGTDGDSILWFPHPSRGNTAEAFAYTLDAGTPDNGLATVKLLAGSSCNDGDSIEIMVFIPSGDEAHIGQAARQPTRIEAEQNISGIFYSSLPDDAYEENDISDDAYQLGQNWDYEISRYECLSDLQGQGVAYDDDWYYVQFNTDMITDSYISLSSGSTAGNIDLYLYDCAVLGSCVHPNCSPEDGCYELSSTSPGNTEQINRPVYVELPSGTFYIKVTPVSGSGIPYDLCWQVDSTCQDGHCYDCCLYHESPENCPWDCACNCGDGVCVESWETDPDCLENDVFWDDYCPEDCGCRGYCGDTYCDAGYCGEDDPGHPDYCPDDCGY